MVGDTGLEPVASCLSSKFYNYNFFIDSFKCFILFVLSFILMNSVKVNFGLFWRIVFTISSHSSQCFFRKKIGKA